MILAVGHTESNRRGVSTPAPSFVPPERNPAGRQAFDEWMHTSLEELRSVTARTIAELGGRGHWVLELGCGHGHYLTEFAQLNPHVQCLGVDFCRDRIHRAVRKQSRAALRNLQFLRAEVRQFLLSLPPDLLFSQVFILFPDPWPKRRHRKNRLVTPDLLTRLARICAPQGRLFFRSDALDYVSEVRTAIQRHAHWVLQTEELLPLESPTVFQQRAETFGTIVAELIQPSSVKSINSAINAPPTSTQTNTAK